MSDDNNPSIFGDQESTENKTSSKSVEQKKIIDKIINYAETFPCQAGEEILLHESQAFYYIKKGVIEVSYTAHETKITVALLGEGNFFGEIGFFDGGSRVRNIRATEDAEIYAFNVPVVEKLFHENPRLYGRLVTHLSQLICRKFRRVLEENEPLTSYAASLTSKGRGFTQSQQMPEKFLKSSAWHTVNKEVEESKAALFDISHRLQEDHSPLPGKDITDECFKILDEINANLAKYNLLIENQEDKNLLWGYIFKEIFPYIMRSRFVERAYYKPKGYAGDFLMMEHIYRDKPEGDGKMGSIIDAWCLQRPGAKAIRGRRELLSTMLSELSLEFLQTTSPIKIMNLACGPNRELFDFLKKCDHSQDIEALCIDIDSEALEFSNQHVNIFPHKASIRFMNENLVKWALGRVSHQIGKQHIIYSAGLCDYLDKRLFQALISRCHEYLEPGGKLILGNFAPYPDQIIMDEILHWHLLYRTPDDLIDIFKDTPFGTTIDIISEPENVNIFAVGTRR